MEAAIRASAIEQLIAATRRVSPHGPIRRADFDRCAEETRLPASLYAEAEAALVHSGVSIDDDEVEDEDDESDGPDHGWNADGFNVFMVKAKHRILTAAEEQALGEVISRGRLAAEVLGENHEMTHEQRRRFEQLELDGVRASNELALHNIRLVVSVAKTWSAGASPALEFEDLVAEGYVGLAHAIEKWDHTRGLKLSTYATWWIRQAISRAIADKSRTIRLPVHLGDSISRLRREQRLLLQELEREPTLEELAERTELSVRRVRNLIRVMQPARSLERFEHQGTQFADSTGQRPEQYAMAVALHEELLEVLMELTDRERIVVCKRFGLDGSPPQTLEQIGDQFGVTRERIRQIESKTLAKLRHPDRRDRLAEYLKD